MKPRKVPISLQERVDSEINRLVSDGVLRPVETSDWGTPIVPILKKNGEIRICADYRTTINQHLVDNKYVLPNIDDIFAALCGGKYFTKLDMRNAYNQLELCSESQMLLVWSTHKGVFACNRLPFGENTACAIFQSTISRVLQGCAGCVVFFDDILVTGATMEEHLLNLLNVIEKLLAAGFRLNYEKCAFFQADTYKI